jgi:hypothetical protein
MKIYFINSKAKNCGVYQYGLRLWDSIKNSKYNISYYEINTKEEFYSLNISDADIIFLNWIEGGESGPFGWFDYDICNFIKQYNIPTVSIQHTDQQHTAHIDYFLSQNPKKSGMPRPLYDFNRTKINNNKINIGSFGLAFNNKNFNKVVQLINNEFDECEINIHITKAFYSNNNMDFDFIISNLKNISLKPNNNLNITTNFISNEELLFFIDKNDLIVLMYDDSTETSSVIDYVISAETPVAITNVPAFEHIYDPNIDLNNNSLSSIIKYTNNKNLIKNYKNIWSKNNLKIFIDNALLNIFKKQSYSQVYQDLFVYELIGKNGFFLDLGAGWDNSCINSNTLCLEKYHNWNGINIDANTANLNLRKSESIRSESICCKIPDTSIESILNKVNAPQVIDYISIDIDPSSIIALENFPFHKYSFKILTFEHDSYIGGNMQQNRACEILSHYGYVRLCENICVPETLGINKYFEDWWINSMYFTDNFISKNTFKNCSGEHILSNLNKE